MEFPDVMKRLREKLKRAGLTDAEIDSLDSAAEDEFFTESQQSKPARTLH